MAKTWILVAHRGGARLFENRGPGKGLELLQDVDHPAGKLKNKDIDSDKPGRKFSGSSPGRHGAGHDQEPTEHIAEQFAKRLSGLLDQGRVHQQFDSLVLVAEPRFLGALRAALSIPTAAMVTTTLGKDLGAIEARGLPNHLENVVRL
jgi:protein required for attachment to host cells